MINSDFKNGLSRASKSKIIKEIEKLKIGEKKITFRLKDQNIKAKILRCPIPMIHLEDGSIGR